MPTNRFWMTLPLLLVTIAAALAGCHDDASSTSSQTDAAAQSPATEGVWAERAPLLDPNSEMAVAELDGRIYVIGGYPSTRVYVNTVQVYEAATDSWS